MLTMKPEVVARSPRRRARRILLGGCVLIAVSAGLVAIYPRRPKVLDCESASRTESYGVVSLVCRAEYEQTKDPASGARLADALQRGGDRSEAKVLAKGLALTEARADAYRILGEIAISEERMQDAAALLQRARALHLVENRRAELARDDLALAEIHAGYERYDEALRILDECVEASRSASARAVEGLCHLAAARVLSLVGYIEKAREEFDRAEPLISHDRELTKLSFERGNIEQEVSRGRDRATNEKRALVSFEDAREHAERAQLTSWAAAIEVNRAFSLAELGRIDEAEHHLAEAAALDLDQEYERERAQLAARIAYRRGDLTRASSLNEQAYPAIEDHGDRFEVCVMQARIALASEDPRAAEKWARRGIEEVEQIRAAQTAIELRPWVLASRRAPYELLFSILARANRFEEAIAVFDQWQGRTLVDALAPSSADPSLGLADTAREIQSITRRLPAVASTPLMAAGGRAVVETLRTTDLFALVIAEGELWRVTASRGRIWIDGLGTYDDALEARVAGFQAAPTDRTLAGELGELLVPAELFRDSSTLYVVLDAQLGALPVVALRRGGRALIDARPLLRVPRLPAGATCVAPASPGGATILADARGDLPDARREADRIATLFETRALVGAAATSAALFAARSSPVLHVAVHAHFDAEGGRLQLHDRDVSALEIAAARLGPSLVVLASCSSARSGDPELARSLSTAFLAGGSSHVIATLRPVADAGALELTSRFYAEGGARDPVRTLAAIQAKLADGDNKDWPSFVVFGHDVCR